MFESLKLRVLLYVKKAELKYVNFRKRVSEWKYRRVQRKIDRLESRKFQREGDDE